MPAMGPGTRLKGIGSAHGERLIEGTIEIAREIPAKELPAPLGQPIYNVRQFPSVERGGRPSVLELVKLGAENARYGDRIWAGAGNLKFFPSDIEEHMLLAPREVLGAYRYSSGYTFPGGKVLERWES
jgi:acetoacetate decarboxylase